MQKFEKLRDCMLLDNRDQWIKLLQTNSNITKSLLEEIEAILPKITVSCLKQIRIGLESGLSTEQLNVYVKPEFNASQMEEIREGFKDGLSEEQVRFYANPEFKDYLMHEIRKGFKDGLTEEQIKLYANSKFNFQQIKQIVLGLKAGLSEEQIKSYAKPSIEASTMLRKRKRILNAELLNLLNAY